ncbi:MAG: hypothetical protein AB7Q30_04355 [Vicinamibacteria bacterium]
MSRTRLRQASPSLALAVALGLGLARPAQTQDFKSWSCTQVQGNLTEVVVDQQVSPFDTFGRVVSTADGGLQSVGTAIITGVGPGSAPGTLEGTASRWIVLSPNDHIYATDHLLLTPIPNTPDVDDVVTITIRGGQGKYERAAGQIVATGRGYNFFPLPPGPVAGKAYFTFRYTGEICVP